VLIEKPDLFIEQADIRNSHWRQLGQPGLFVLAKPERWHVLPASGRSSPKSHIGG
jgi:hypothetical protein